MASNAFSVRAQAHGVRPRPGVVGQMPPRPMLFERQYARRLRLLHAQWADHVEHIARGLLNGRTDARRADAGGSLEEQLRAAYDALVKASGLEQFLGRFAGGISDANREYVKRVTKLPPGSIARQQVIEDFRRENVGLIKGLSEYQSSEVAGVLREAQASGARWEETVPAIKDRLGVGLSRAKLIARDQTNKFNGSMQQLHQTASGIEEYEWVTAGDMAVRGRPGGEYAKSKENHWALQGTRQRWDAPPLIPGTAVHSAPGQRIQCRCQARPIIPFFEP